MSPAMIEVGSDYLADAPPTVVRLEARPHFEALTDRQRRYAHFISRSVGLRNNFLQLHQVTDQDDRASFLGTRIILRQVSPESEAIFDLIVGLYRASLGNWKELQTRVGIDDGQLDAFLDYAGQFLGNVGNYKAVGDVKFVPRISPDALGQLASIAPETARRYETCRDGIFADHDARKMHLGHLEDGHRSAYYPDSPSITKEEIALVGQFLEGNGRDMYNTRLRKSGTAADFDLLIASAHPRPSADETDLPAQTEWALPGKLTGSTLRFVYGDHSPELAKIVEAIDRARAHADNDTQARMHAEYARSFRSGSAEAFKRSQRHWIHDKGPMVESNIGFIESYRDPQGVRAEWEGFVAMVNQDRTRAFERLVATAEAIIPKLPWPKDFEKDHFFTPDFTSLEVLSFAGSMIPAGINIPNLDDLRQTEGFKNVSLGNVLSAKAPREVIPFIRDEDLDLFTRHRDTAFEVQLGLHELLGHGTGKLLQETSVGQYNFDVRHPPISPVTGQTVTTWYKPGQTWASVFGSIAASYEECRAECVAMALSCEPSALKAFGLGDGGSHLTPDAEVVLYVAWLQMARAGLTSLEYYDPPTRKWGQAHAQARFSILRCFLDVGDDFVRLEHQTADLSDLRIVLDRSKILSHGRPAVERYLQKLHVFKSTADVEAGRTLYEGMTAVHSDFWASTVRHEVLRRRTPRKVFVQANTVLDESSQRVSLKEYDPTREGMIQSWAERDV